VPHGVPERLHFVNNWIELKRKDETIPALCEPWILGKSARKKTARWSVVRDVLGWVK
jgi:hypothetical protein